MLHLTIVIEVKPMFGKFLKYIESSGHWNVAMVIIISTFTAIIILPILYSVFKKDKKKSK